MKNTTIYISTPKTDCLNMTLKTLQNLPEKNYKTLIKEITLAK